MLKLLLMILSELVQAWRKSYGISLRKLAKQIGCDHTTLLRFERGKTVEDRPLALIIAWALSQKNENH